LVYKQLEQNLNEKADEIEDSAIKTQLKKAAGVELKNISSMKLDKSITYAYNAMVRKGMSKASEGITSEYKSRDKMSQSKMSNIGY
jgi:hypothetical protein